jgi:hypothetical protein
MVSGSLVVGLSDCTFSAIVIPTYQQFRREFQQSQDRKVEVYEVFLDIPYIVVILLELINTQH